MTLYKPRTRKCVKRYRFLSFAREYKKEIVGYRTRFLKTASKKVTHQIDALWANKTADAVTNSNDKKTVKSKPAEETDIPQEKQRSKINRIKTSIIKMNTTQYVSY